MIDKILTTQPVGSTSTESSKRTEPARRGGDSFESVLAREAKTKDKTKTSPDVETPSGAEHDDKASDAENNAKATAADQHAKGEESHPEQDAGEPSLVSPDENPESEWASVIDTATQSDVEEALEQDGPEEPARVLCARTSPRQSLGLSEDETDRKRTGDDLFWLVEAKDVHELLGELLE